MIQRKFLWYNCSCANTLYQAWKSNFTNISTNYILTIFHECFRGPLIAHPCFSAYDQSYTFAQPAVQTARWS